jgi:predicted nucleic acid-binding Zn ribbon protein
MPTSEEDELRALTDDVRRRQRHIPPPKKMADVLSALLARRGYAREQSADQFQAIWQQSAGERLGPHSRAGNLRRGVLEVVVRNSAVLQELTFQKKQLLQKLNRLSPDQNIQSLRFKVGVID